MNNPRKLILKIITASCVVLALSIGVFIFVIKKNGITEFDSITNDDKQAVVKIKQTSPEFKLGESIFMEDCRKCHVSKEMNHNYIEGVVENVGISYLKLYLTKQDSLLKAKDKYALDLKEMWGNNGTIHKFNYTEDELDVLIEYLK